MEITVSRTEGEVPVTILRLDCELDALTTDQAQKQAELEIDQGAQNLLLDLSGVPFMSSSGVRMIYALFNKLHPLSSSKEDLERAKQMREDSYTAPHLKILSPT
ncbi:MAG: STAS domain-containing protein, partial [Chloroflexota bacterium]|nr:STAS domain-containing protein [Chloroflexota bacterium]